MSKNRPGLRTFRSTRELCRPKSTKVKSNGKNAQLNYCTRNKWRITKPQTERCGKHKTMLGPAGHTHAAGW